MRTKQRPEIFSQQIGASVFKTISDDEREDNRQNNFDHLFQQSILACTIDFIHVLELLLRLRSGPSEIRISSIILNIHVYFTPSVFAIPYVGLCKYLLISYHWVPKNSQQGVWST